jgi:hypothetical protein
LRDVATRHADAQIRALPQVCNPVKALSDTEEKWAEQRQKWAEQQHSPFVLYTLARAPPRCTLRVTLRSARTVARTAR